MLKKVSVIIPTYNRPKVLLKSIETVLNQTYPGEIEIVIVDDSDKSQKEKINIKFKSKLRKNRDIKYIYMGNPRGSPLARNIGIKESTGEYIAFLDDDDEWISNKIEKQISMIEKDENIGLVICYSLDKRFRRRIINKPPQNITHKMILKSFNLSSTSSYLIRRKALEKVDGFDINLPSAQEYDLAIRLSVFFKISCVKEVLIVQNETNGQISQNWKRKISGIMAIYKKYHEEYRIIDCVKTIGILGLFYSGNIFGNRIYSIIIPLKRLYET